MISAGERDKRITIQAPTITRDGYNQPITAYVDLYTVYAAAKTEGSKEVYFARKLYAETQMVFSICYKKYMRKDYRVKYGNRYFNIIGIDDPEEKHIELSLSCKEAV